MPESTVATYESILNCIKQMLGLESDYTPFDLDIIVHINTTLSKLTQVGVGPKEGFEIDITNPTAATWTDFIGPDSPIQNMVKTYVYLNVRLLFDPPPNSFVLDAFKTEADEYLWRINVEVDKWERNHEEA